MDKKQTNPSIIVIGLPGKGKSTILNFLSAGKDGGKFATGKSSKPVTTYISKASFKIFKGVSGQEYDFYDIPGLLDGDQPFDEWGLDFIRGL